MSISAIKILGLLLVIALWAGNCQGQTENESNNDVALNSESTNLNYIWSVTGIEEDGQVIMLLRQEGGDLYGRAKFEPDSGQAWNGLVVGMIEDENVKPPNNIELSHPVRPDHTKPEYRSPNPTAMIRMIAVSKVGRNIFLSCEIQGIFKKFPTSTG